MGVECIQVQPFLGLRSIWLFLALAFGLAMVGHAAFWLLRQPAGDYPALLISVIALGFSGHLLWRKFSFRDYPLRTNLPHAPSQNVIAVLPPASQLRHQVVLVGHLDSHRAVFWFATDFMLILFGISSIISLYGVYLAILVYILAVLTQVQFFAWVGLFLAFFHFISWFTGVTADLGRYSPGANDNASGVATVLALAERLKAQPLQNTEVWLAFTGCEESGCDGMLNLIREHGETLKKAVFIDFEMVGMGDQLSYTSVEGNLHRRHIPQDVQDLLEQVGKPFGLKNLRGPLAGAFSEAGTLWSYGFKAACISSFFKGSPLLAEWHRLTDVPARVQVSSLEHIQELGWALLQAIDNRPA